MKVTAALITLSLALFVQANPVEPNSALKDKKYDIQWCKKEDYHDCEKYEDCKPKKCYDLDSDYNNKCESVKHSSYVNCYYYDKKDCKGDYLYASGNYKELPKKWKHEISSWYCEEEEDDHDRHD